MAGENFQIYSLQITGKCLCETFPPPLHDLTIRPPVKQSPINLSKKICSSMESFFKKKVPNNVFLKEETLCFIFISFPIFKSFIPNFWDTNHGLSNKTTYPLYGYEIMVMKFLEGYEKTMWL